MPSQFTSKLASLGFELPEWCVPPSEPLVREYEARFALTLPADYREFLVHHGGVTGLARCTFLEPTPCGTDSLIDRFYGFTGSDRDDNVGEVTELIEGAPDVVALGDNQGGGMFWLKCSGGDCGHVYLHDHEQRASWPDERFYERFSNLSDSIRDYLALRQRGELPKKPRGYDHVYRLATTFGAFIERLKKIDD